MILVCLKTNLLSASTCSAYSRFTLRTAVYQSPELSCRVLSITICTTHCNPGLANALWRGRYQHIIGQHWDRVHPNGTINIFSQRVCVLRPACTMLQPAPPHCAWRMHEYATRCMVLHSAVANLNNIFKWHKYFRYLFTTRFINIIPCNSFHFWSQSAGICVCMMSAHRCRAFAYRHADERWYAAALVREGWGISI